MSYFIHFRACKYQNKYLSGKIDLVYTIDWDEWLDGNNTNRMES